MVAPRNKRTLHSHQYFEANRRAYYDGLLSVSRDRDWTAWCRYFLEALRTQAQRNYAAVTAISRCCVSMVCSAC